MELKDRELKDREEKLRKRMREREREKNYFRSRLLCLKMIWVGLENKKWRKNWNEKKTNKKNWNDWLIKQTMTRKKKPKKK